MPRQPHARYWPVTTKRRAQQLRASGNTVNQISAALGVPFGTVRRWVYEGAAV
ncbi:helix-turn-helix domain-containing protein [Stenotrophomonas sp. C2852]|uniref:helix-turn-helix domain-containing protein n=1 Tax=Stenotrophomonas sp. C2852 TaxID=3077845 RepID=UPI00359FB10F